MQKKLILQNIIFTLIIAVGLVSLSTTYAQTPEEKMLVQKAHQERFKDIEEIVGLVKESWAVLESCHKGIVLNKRIKDALTECWRNAYMQNDASYSTKITQQDILRLFEQFLIELNTSISYYQKHTAMTAIHSNLYQFSAEQQTEFRPTIERAQKLMVKHLEPYFSPAIKAEIEADTNHFFKEGFRFVLFVILKKYNKRFSNEDERFINEKMTMFLTEAGRSYPYISATQFEAWVFATLYDVLFAECQICMDRKADRYLACCKTRSICTQCYAKVYECPFCRAAKI